MMRVTAIIPTRGDREAFVEHCKFLLARQTRQFDRVIWVDDPPLTGEKDITFRYRKGISEAAPVSDVIFLWEDDDWYHEKYVENMLAAWEMNGRPQVFGLASTCYYHLESRRGKILKHRGRASAMSTIISSAAVENIQWPSDTEPFFDIRLWKSLRGVAIDTEELLCVGIKHGVGLCGGMGHRSGWSGYDNIDDARMSWLSAVVDPESFSFYTKISRSLNAKKNKDVQPAK